jgi:hypothetical protein
MAVVTFGPTKRGDRKTSLLMQLKRGDGTLPDLTGLLTSAIRVHLKDRATKIVTQGNASAIVGLATDATVRYDPTAFDVSMVREYEIEVQVTHLDGLTETFPTCDQFLWPIVGDLA